MPLENTTKMTLRRRNTKPQATQFAIRDKNEISLLVILDCNRRKPKHKDLTYSDWMRAALVDEDANYLLNHEALQGFVYLLSTSDADVKRGKRLLIMQETLYMTYAWQKRNPDITVTYMDLDLLLRIFDGGKEAIDHIGESFTAFFGGVDLAVDPKDYYIQFEDQKAVDNYIDRLQYLSSIIPVWPPIPELLRSRHKYDVIRDLDHIAQYDTVTARPRTVLLADEPWVDDTSFLKREGSDCGRHICRPEDAVKLARKDIERMASEQPFRWIKQDVVPALKSIGEWRVLMIGGRVLYTLVTLFTDDGRIAADLRLAGYTLEEMERLMSNEQDYIPDDIVLRVGGTVQERRDADHELFRFCQTTLKALVLRERFPDSSLRLICRLDISVIRNQNGQLNYFVNEVERGFCICLFGMVETDHLVDRVADELGVHYVKWIRERIDAIRRKKLE